MDGENIECDTKTIVRTENILSVFWAKLRFQIYPGKCGRGLNVFNTAPFL